jgi:hypothetical protein
MQVIDATVQQSTRDNHGMLSFKARKHRQKRANDIFKVVVEGK